MHSSTFGTRIINVLSSVTKLIRNQGQPRGEKLPAYFSAGKEPACSWVRHRPANCASESRAAVHNKERNRGIPELAECQPGLRSFTRSSQSDVAAMQCWRNKDLTHFRAGCHAR
jgi:hypothetical protein